MYKILFTGFLLLINCIIPLQGQIMKSIVTPEQEMIEKAVENSLYIIKVEYALLPETGSDTLGYGSDDKSYFGKDYFLGVHVDSMMMLAPQAMTPWNNDPEFNSLQDRDTIKPALSKVEYKPLKGEEFIQMDFENGLIPADTTEGVIRPREFNYKPGGLTRADITADSTGWVVLCYADIINDSINSIEHRINVYRPQPTFNSKQFEAKLKEPYSTQNLLGGFYIIPKYATGKIILEAWGMLHKKPLNWYIIAFSDKGKSPETPLQQPDE